MRRGASSNNRSSWTSRWRYIRRGLGPARAVRVEIPAAAPRALDERAQVRYLRAVQRCPSPRDQALALVPFYAGARISEIVALDVDDVARSARKGVLRILGKGQRVRKVPIHPQLHTALTDWLNERADWPGAKDNPALFLNQRGQRLSVRGAHDIVTAITAAAGLEDDTTVHVLRHTFATTLVRGGTDLVIVAELLGHARLETTRGYTRPSAKDRTRALNLLLRRRIAALSGPITPFGLILAGPPEQRVEKTLTDDLKRVRGKHGIFFRLAAAAVEQPTRRSAGPCSP